MVKQATISKLREIRLSAMAEAFENQCANPEHFEGLSFEDRLGMLVDKEWEKRRNTRLDKLVYIPEAKPQLHGLRTAF